jgi:hypothetical protein
MTFAEVSERVESFTHVPQLELQNLHREAAAEMSR